MFAVYTQYAAMTATQNIVYYYYYYYYYVIVICVAVRVSPRRFFEQRYDNNNNNITRLLTISIARQLVGIYYNIWYTHVPRLSVITLIEPSKIKGGGSVVVVSIRPAIVN